MTQARRDLLRLEFPLGVLGATFVALAGVFTVVGIPPLPPAPLVALGIPSPLTGMTRSFVALASGDLSGAFGWHPLGPLVFAASVGAIIVAAVSWVRGRRLQAVAHITADRRIWIVLSAAVVIAWARQIAVLG